MVIERLTGITKIVIKKACYLPSVYSLGGRGMTEILVKSSIYHKDFDGEFQEFVHFPMKSHKVLDADLFIFLPD